MARRLIFVHGIKQDPAGKDALHAKWRKILVDNAVQPGLIAAAQSAMAFYADILGPAASGPAIVAMSAAGTGAAAGEMAFLSAGLYEMAQAAGASHREIEAAAASEVGALEVVAQSSALGRTLVGALSAIEARIPLAGSVGVRVLKEAYVYLSRPRVQRDIDARVRTEIEAAFDAGERAVIVSHSLGTVVAFRLLREMSGEPAHAAAIASGKLPVPLLVTLGSPLAITAVRNKLGPPGGRPKLAVRWANFYDRGDLVALGRGLTIETFGAGIENDDAVDNDTLNAHSIEGYLNHRAVVECIEQALQRTD